MTDPDPHTIRDEATLREVVGPSVPGVATKVGDCLDAYAIDFIARSPFLVLATADDEGNLDASPKGDGPGFVRVEDERTVVVPDRVGNRLVYGHLNVLRNPKVGLMFVVPGTPETLRINGRAELTSDPELLARLPGPGKPAVLAIRVHVDECFFHCGKAFLRSKLWQPDSWPERKKISFGRMLKEKLRADEATVQSIDAAIEADYRENL